MIPQQIADIYAQAGGCRAMSTVYSGWSYSSQDVSATFTIAPDLLRRTRDGITHVRATLQSSGAYLVEFLAVSRASPAGREVARDDGVYTEDLRNLIESRTGLRLPLGDAVRR